MGFSLGLSGSKEKSKSTSKPWQEGQLRFAFDEARKAFDQGSYQGPYAAPIDPMQQAAYDTASGMAGMYGAGGQDLYGAGASMLPYAGQAGEQYAGAAGGDWLSGYENPMAGGMDPNVVGSYIDNDILQGQINAATRDTWRGLDEQSLPGARFQAATGGMSGGSPQRVAEGIATRGAQDRVGDISAGMRYNAYQTGVNADRARQGFGQSAIMGDLQNRQFGTQGMAGIGSTGANMMQTGLQVGAEGLDLQAGYGDYMQGLNQNQITGDMAQFNAPWDLVNRYYGIVGAGNWGGETKSKGRAAGASVGYGLK